MRTTCASTPTVAVIAKHYKRQKKQFNLCGVHSDEFSRSRRPVHVVTCQMRLGTTKRPSDRPIHSVFNITEYSVMKCNFGCGVLGGGQSQPGQAGPPADKGQQGRGRGERILEEWPSSPCHACGIFPAAAGKDIRWLGCGEENSASSVLSRNILKPWSTQASLHDPRDRPEDQVPRAKPSRAAVRVRASHHPPSVHSAHTAWGGTSRPASTTTGARWRRGRGQGGGMGFGGLSRQGQVWVPAQALLARELPTPPSPHNYR